MKWFVSIIVVILYSQKIYAQDFASTQNLEYQLLNGPIFIANNDSIATTPVAPKHKLLPTNMSFMEKALWDENGIFRKTGLASPLTPEVRKSELDLRRTMLTAHQIGGFVTLGLMTTAVVYGQRYLDNGQRGDLRTHKAFVTAIIISYTGTGLLSVLSPPPLIRRDEVSTTTIHKTLAWVHFLGMVVTPLIGQSIKHSSNYSDEAHFHQVSAYVTLAALTASMITVTF